MYKCICVCLDRIVVGYGSLMHVYVCLSDDACVLTGKWNYSGVPWCQAVRGQPTV